MDTIYKRISFGIVALILALIGIFFGSYSHADSNINSDVIANSDFLNKLQEPINGYMNIGNFVIFAQNFKYDLNPTKRTLVVFTASYCTACKSYVPQIENLEIVKNKQVNLVVIFLPGSRNKDISSEVENKTVDVVSYFENKDAMMGFSVPALPRVLLLESDGCMLRFEHPLSFLLQPNQLLE